MSALSASAGNASASKMSYIDILNRFWQLDAEQKFAPNATRLYFFLVAECNRQRWKNPFSLADGFLCLVLKMPKNTMKPARAELIERGVIVHQPGGNGAGDSSVYALQFGQDVAALKVSKSDTFQPDKGSDSDTLSENKGSDMVAISDPLTTDKGSDKVSDFDPTIYKEKTKTSSVVKEEEEEPAPSPAPVEKKNTSQPESKKPEPQTEGGRRLSAHDEPADLLSADEAPLLANPLIFRAACIDEGYPKIDFEHYRLSIINASRDEELKLPIRKWRARVRRWLENAKASKNGLILAAIPGQTQADPRAMQPLATTSSASPTKKNKWS